ncbi:signal peptidase II [Alkalibacter mobilis]|uniref:signal peptidase II n=1 Tax=Alkalibacter mobilis TaxID=2787712 RepID=UPI00189FC1FC|nr:signal peptidase II [Alkalibacter mobilis]MBF7097266.1 signal peptidase II [Alkalibacter mobilis]
MVKLLICLFVIVLGIMADLSTKKMARDKLMPNYPKKVWGRLYLVLVYNKGAAFGILKRNRKVLMFFSTLAIIVILLVFFYSIIKNLGYDYLIPLSFVIAGALSNYYERMFKGRVTDFIFIKIKRFPVFNLADLYIFVGGIFAYANSGLI